MNIHASRDGLNVLVVQTAFLGDVLLSLPLCKALKDLLGANVTIVTTPQAAPMLEGLPFIDKIVVFEKRGKHRRLLSALHLARSLRKDADVVLVPHRSIRTAIFVRGIGSRNVVTFSSCATRFVANNVIDDSTAMHDAERQLLLLQPLYSGAIPSVRELLPIAIAPTIQQGATFASIDSDARTAMRQNPYIVIAPGSVWPTKQWSREHVRAFSAQMAESGYVVVAIGDPSVKGWVGEQERIHDLCGQTTLREAASIIAGASVVVTNDSSPLHIASLHNVPTVALFGPTIPEFGFGPIGEQSIVVQKALTCRPCSAHGGLKCPIGTHECMTSILPAEVRTAVTALL